MRERTMSDIDGREAKRAMLEWVDSHTDSLVQALHGMAERCEANAHAMDLVGETYVASIARESAAAWRAKAAELLDRYEALPDRELF